MLARFTIRKKLFVGVALLLAIVLGLSVSGFQGVYSYRELARGISQRASEMPLAADLTRRAGELRMTLSLAQQRPEFGNSWTDPISNLNISQQFRTNVAAIKESLRKYRVQLEETDRADTVIGDNRREWETVNKIQRSLARIEKTDTDQDWLLVDVRLMALSDESDELYRLTNELPGFMQERMHGLTDEVKGQYRTWITATWTSTISAVALLGLAVYFGYRWIFLPLEVLVTGSRRVASGDFKFRIALHSKDEMAELAAAMNHMTERFGEIRDDLDRQVRERTKEVVRSEQLASVGFLAAGVAHEINNPLAAIAICAESLEMRLHDIIQADDEQPDDQHNEEISILRKYLRRIQDEAFRCKGITEQLLDFSRLGDVPKQNADLVELTQGVIDMIRHLGKYRTKSIEFSPSEHVVAPVNAQEMKQVLLNLLTNALDSLDSGGAVRVDLRRRGDKAVLIVSDNGCGMTPEVMRHLFEPFFTRRRDGQGTGLGLSITYRIVQDHGGEITAQSQGPGCGSEFCVTLPLVQRTTTHEKRQAA